MERLKLTDEELVILKRKLEENGISLTNEEMLHAETGASLSKKLAGDFFANGENLNQDLNLVPLDLLSSFTSAATAILARSLAALWASSQEPAPFSQEGQDKLLKIAFTQVKEDMGRLRTQIIAMDEADKQKNTH